MVKFDINNWLEVNNAKQIKISDLSHVIKPGSGIYIGSACSEPISLTSYIASENFQREFRDCQIYHFFSISDQKFFNEESPTQFRHNTLSIIASPQMRDAVNSGKGDYTPIRSADIPVLLENRQYNIDFAIIQVSPPDKNGWCSLGINVDVNRSIIDVASTIIAQINPQMPRTIGDSFIRLSDIDYFVYEDSPLLEYKSPQPDEKSEKIAEYVSRLVENGSTLNLGIGKIPYILPKYLNEKENLGFFSEIMIESIIPLIENEVITCKKSNKPHCMASFAIGTKKLYEFINNNTFTEFHPTNYITNINNIAKNDKMCSVYTALSVDLIGQVTNDMKSTLYTGIGGEADFMRGTALSKGGKCIIALPSVTEDGRSRILPILTTEPIAVPSFDVHYIVTEYGIAHIHGKSLRDRIMLMIGIAHPNHRQWLLESAQKFHYVYEDQKIPQTVDGVVVICPDYEWIFTTKNNLKVHVRPVKPTDERMIQELYYSLSDLDRIMRFFRPHKFFSHEETQKQIICDYQTSMVIVAIIEDENQIEKIVGIAAYYSKGAGSNYVDFSCTVNNNFRRQGIATYLFERIIEIAQKNGYKGLDGDVLISNKGMLKILRSSQHKVDFHPEEDSLEFRVNF